MPLETLDGWHSKVVDQIRILAKAQGIGKDEYEVTRHLFQRLSVLLVKGNAALLLNRIPSHPMPEIDGVM